MNNELNHNNLPEDLPEEQARHRNWVKEYLILILGAGTIIFLDTWTKTLVNRHIPVGGAWLPESLKQFLGFFRVTHFHNRGTAFSMFDSTEQINGIISLLALVVAVFIVIIFPRISSSERALRAALVLELGGTVGNLISRVQYGYVLDFISVGNFAVFNIADASLVTGASLMVLAVILEEIRERRAARKVPPNPDTNLLL